MHTKAVSKQSIIKQDIIHISILLIIALCIGIYLISTTVLISKDSVTYINYAKGLQGNTVETMNKEAQHPGYPVMILGMHKLTKLLSDNKDISGWIYSAQTATLMFRLLTIIVLYFLSKRLVRAKFSFLGVLILILLPKPAEYGSDALSDWPHLFFLASGILLLMQAPTNRKWWMFGIAGVISGLGYLIRPECIQVVMYGLLWLLLQLFVAKRDLSRAKVFFAMILLIIGFSAIAWPYMNLKGAIFPKKQIGKFVHNSQSCVVPEYPSVVKSGPVYTSNIVPSSIAKALGKLVNNLGETVMWVFLPALLIGTLNYIKRYKWSNDKPFFIQVFIALNIVMVVWLYCHSNYMSTRHTMPLVAITILFVPTGLKTISDWLQKKHPRPKGWVTILLVIGLCICIPKLLTPIRAEKRGYREAANWIAEHSCQEDKIYLINLDKRIGFYAQRDNLTGHGICYFEQAKYVVHKARNREDILPYKQLRLIKSLLLGRKNMKHRVRIYRTISVQCGSLVGHWPMDDNTSSTTVCDSSLGYNGTAKRNTGQLSIPGVVDRALIFDGNADYIDLSLERTFSTGAWSVSLWFYTNDIDSLQNFVSTSTSNPLQWFGLHGRKVAIWNTVTHRWCHANTSLSNGKWYHCVLVYDGLGGYVFYLDGIADSGIYNINKGNNTGTIRFIGVYCDALTRHFNGAIDNVKIFNEALDESEISKLYCEGNAIDKGYLGSNTYEGFYPTSKDAPSH